MNAIAELLKPTEAAVISGVELSIVNHAIERALPARVVRRGKGKGVSAEACFYIAFYHYSADKLTADERKLAILDIDRRIGDIDDDAAGRWFSLRQHCTFRHEFLVLDLEGFWTRTHDLWGRYVAAREAVTTNPEILGGTPVIAGTRIPVHDIARSVVSGLPLSRISNAYPSLSEEQIELATLYARANPLQGRPPEKRPLEDAKILSRRVVKRKQNEA